MLSVGQFAVVLRLVPVNAMDATAVAFVYVPEPVSPEPVANLQLTLYEAVLLPPAVAPVVILVLFPSAVGAVTEPLLKAKVITKSFVATAERVQLVAVAEHWPSREIAAIALVLKSRINTSAIKSCLIYSPLVVYSLSECQRIVRNQRR